MGGRGRRGEEGKTDKLGKILKGVMCNLGVVGVLAAAQGGELDVLLGVEVGVVTSVKLRSPLFHQDMFLMYCQKVGITSHVKLWSRNLYTGKNRKYRNPNISPF